MLFTHHETGKYMGEKNDERIEACIKVTREMELATSKQTKSTQETSI